MDLGSKLLQARQEAGLSQRQLCEGIITRNMLSQIEHGTARPSMDTLLALAGRLNKPLSWFLDEDALRSPNQAVVFAAREALKQGDHSAVLKAVETYQAPDPVFDPEMALLKNLALLEKAEQAAADRRFPYARQLAETVETETLYWNAGLERRRLLLLLKTQSRERDALCRQLPSLDEELLFRGEAALERNDPARCARILDAAEETCERWYLLRGQAACGLNNFREAVHYLHKAEGEFPGETARLLEQCYRELEDYKQAYFYACKQK